MPWTIARTFSANAAPAINAIFIALADTTTELIDDTIRNLQSGSDGVTITSNIPGTYNLSFSGMPDGTPLNGVSIIVYTGTISGNSVSGGIVDFLFTPDDEASAKGLFSATANGGSPPRQNVPPGGTLVVDFITTNSTYALANADSTPIYVVYRNGASTGLTGTLTSPGTGQYNLSLPIGSPWVNGDTGYVLISATIGGLVRNAQSTFNVMSSASVDVNVVSTNGHAAQTDANGLPIVSPTNIPPIVQVTVPQTPIVTPG